MKRQRKSDNGTSLRFVPYYKLPFVRSKPRSVSEVAYQLLGLTQLVSFL